MKSEDKYMANKKLIEVALPLEAINRESSREKSIRQGHPSTLHLWWARRPLAAARAVIWSSLVDDPSSHPEQFPTEEEQNTERQRLFKILENLVVWENSSNADVLDVAKAEIMKSTDGKPPALLDPFAGGGTIPFEAQRLGLEAYANDLNPVAVLINKAMIEIPPQFANVQPINPEANMIGRASGYEGASGIAVDVHYYGEWIRNEAFRRIGHLYPKAIVPKEYGGGEATVVAWIWARTVKCPNPACGCEMPLIKSFELTKKKNSQCYLDPHIEGKKIRYEICKGKTDRKGTINRKGATCLFCGSPVELSYIRECGRKNEIGFDLLAVIVEATKGRLYLPANVDRSPAEIKKPEYFPDSEIAYYPGCTNCKIYGMDHFSDLFTNRQLNSLVTFSDLAVEVREKIKKDIQENVHDSDFDYEKYVDAVQLYLAFGVDRLATRLTKVCLWNTTAETIEQPFGRQAIPMVWTFPEGNAFSNSTGGWASSLDWIPKVLSNYYVSAVKGHVEQHNAMEYIRNQKAMVSTDPPYYSNVPYADLSDFFYIWLRKILRNTYPEVFGTIDTPKASELVAEKYRFDGDDLAAKDFFEHGMFKTFCNISMYVDDAIPLTIYYAFKQTENEESESGEMSTASSGWETMLTALIKAGFLITGTWPIHTERTTGLKNSLNALGTSIVLVCKKRSDNAPICTRRNFINELRRELRPALHKLQSSNIAPVDLAQSAIGPGMGAFSRFSKVFEADGSPMTVRSALQIINQELDLFFNEQDGELDRESRFCVELYTQNAFNDIKFGDADNIARAKNTSVAALASRGVLYAQKGIVHLYGRAELTDKVLNNESLIWLLTQQLTRAMETGGIEACAKIIAPMFGSNAEYAKSLAYRLYTIAERKGWAQEAYAYNSLVIAWTDIQSRAAELHLVEPKQINLFDYNDGDEGGSKDGK
jgi:putative DNA methylase